MAFAAAPLGLCAQNSKAAIPEGTEISIVDHIRQSGHHSIEASSEIFKLLLPEEKSDTPASVVKKTAMRTVYRVQVFSDSNGERSRAEGEKRRRIVKSRFANYVCDLGWHSPYWKVKVGLFLTQSEATKAAAEIKRAFPSYAKEVHVIRERRKVTN